MSHWRRKFSFSQQFLINVRRAPAEPPPPEPERKLTDHVEIVYRRKRRAIPEKGSADVQNG